MSKATTIKLNCCRYWWNYWPSHILLWTTVRGAEMYSKDAIDPRCWCFYHTLIGHFNAPDVNVSNVLWGEEFIKVLCSCFLLPICFFYFIEWIYLWIKIMFTVWYILFSFYYTDIFYNTKMMSDTETKILPRHSVLLLIWQFRIEWNMLEILLVKCWPNFVLTDSEMWPP